MRTHVIYVRRTVQLANALFRTHLRTARFGWCYSAGRAFEAHPEDLFLCRPDVLCVRVVLWYQTEIGSHLYVVHCIRA